MARQPSVTIRNQFVYLLENATINVFDCIDNNTGQRDIYYIQKGRIEDSVQFRETRRTPRQQPTYNQQPNWRPPHYSPPSSSESSSDEDEEENRNNQRTDMKTDRYIEILGSRRTVTDTELKELANKLRFEDDKYRKLALHLEVSQVDIDRIRKEYERKDRTDMIFAILKVWKSASGEPSVSNLGHGLEHCNLKKFVTETLNP
ncbi:uncharacterized protein LOC124274168 [Haliotis rubra]|uniref:uncharacterized protein LOC124274168 n=2 Tax=Haliotis rubra TaxID=36100 RepID=UPI001EE57215|nr:uncharacterized protein LOC124274168 [Haliotis rubra]